ncbi:MAG TPA: hypothetical protein VJR27_04515 [Candidatus Saccharimonadales bacterium]|nr:hypothetical protein [Candidatus Saccharimonadales bacterium]
MARTQSITKRNLITKANKRIVVATAVAAFVVVFALFAAKSLIGQMAYQNKVISGKKKAVAQLKSDLSARDTLVNSYKTFVNTPLNLIGGNPQGTGANDGDNSKVTLDALPSKYDFPALATSLEKIINDQGLQIVSISGTDDEIAQSANQSSSNPQPVKMPFQIQVNGSYAAVQNLISVFDRSIRPFQIQTVELSGTDSSMMATIGANTYYQPEKNLNIKTEVVK